MCSKWSNLQKPDRNAMGRQFTMYISSFILFSFMVRSTLLCTEPSCWPKVEKRGLNANLCNNSRQLDTLMKNLIKIEFYDLSLVEKTLFCDMKQTRSSHLHKTFGDISKWMQNFGARRPKNENFRIFSKSSEMLWDMSATSKQLHWNEF